MTNTPVGYSTQEIADAQHLLAGRGINTIALQTGNGFLMPDGNAVYFSDRRRHFVNEANYTARFDTLIEAVNDWLFYARMDGL